MFVARCSVMTVTVKGLQVPVTTDKGEFKEVFISQRISLYSQPRV